MILYKCISSGHATILVELEAPISQIFPNPDDIPIIQQNVVYYTCREATIRNMTVANGNHNSLSPWINIQTNRRNYKIGQKLLNIRGFLIPGSAQERKWLPSINNNMQHGRYVRRMDNGTALVQGHYKFGKRTGRWLFFDENGNMINEIMYDWRVELAMDEAAKSGDMTAMLQIIYDNWNLLYSKIPGFEDKLQQFFDK